MEGQKKRLAVLVGCNYPNTSNELDGCINDVLAMKDTLVRRFGFDHANIQLLTDAPDQYSSSTMPTGANIKQALANMIGNAEAGDVLYFHYSGHGTRIPSEKHCHPLPDEEAIVPCDFNLITDLDFRQLVNKLPKGASLTILSDSCHSGGLIDKEKEQIGQSSLSDNKNIRMDLSYTPKTKTIPFDSILQHLSSLTNKITSELDIGAHLLVHCFGIEASLSFQLHKRDWCQQLKPDEGILLSGCQSDETSAEMSGGNGMAYGAFSNAVQIVLRDNKGQLSNREVVMKARNILQEQGFVKQHPCLYCSDENANAVFLLECQNNSDM